MKNLFVLIVLFLAITGLAFGQTADIPVTIPLGPYPDSAAMSAGELDVGFILTDDATPYYQMPLTGNELFLVYNKELTSVTCTIVSVADPFYKSTADIVITDDSAGTGLLGGYWFGDKQGWASASTGYATVEAASGLRLACIKLPTRKNPFKETRTPFSTGRLAVDLPIGPYSATQTFAFDNDGSDEATTGNFHIDYNNVIATQDRAFEITGRELFLSANTINAAATWAVQAITNKYNRKRDISYTFDETFQVSAFWFGDWQGYLDIADLPGDATISFSAGHRVSIVRIPNNFGVN